MNIGLIGGSGSGKSYLTQIIAEIYPIEIIEADKLGHELLKSDKEVQEALRELFGEAIFDTTGIISRKKLGSLVFGHPENKQALDQIMWPKIKQIISDHIQINSKRPYPKNIIVDGALLIEAGIDALLDTIWYVDADEETQIERLTTSRHIPRERAQNILSSQQKLEQNKSRADYVINNSLTQTHYALIQQIIMGMKQANKAMLHSKGTTHATI